MRAVFLVQCFPPFLALLALEWLWQFRLAHRVPWGARGAGRRLSPRRSDETDVARLLDVREPLLLPALAERWRAAFAWTPERLAAAIGDQIVQTYTIPRDESRDVQRRYWERRTVPLSMRELLARIFGRIPSEQRCYAWDHDDWTRSELGRELELPQRAGGRRAGSHGLWIGEAGNLTALHYDLWHSFYLQIHGRKRFVLFAPSQSSRLYTVPPWWRRYPDTLLPDDSRNASPEKFPDLAGADRYELNLEPGEVLFIPAFWWHEVESLDPGISLPVRYVPGWWEALFRPALFPWICGTLLRVGPTTKTIAA